MQGRVEGWRADSVRDTSTVPRFQPPPRRTQHADFPHCAPPFASCRGLCVTSGVKLIKNHRFEIIEAAG